MQKIVPYLWLDNQAIEAAKFYASIFKDGKIKSQSQITDTPSGTVDMLSVELSGYQIDMMSAGPLFKLNPSISFMLNFDPSQDPQAREHLDELWAKLSEGGKALMPLQEYPFSERYGWIEDKFGMSWQLILTKPDGEPRPFIIPSMLFVQERAGQAEAAIDFYTSVFKATKRGTTARYPEGAEPDKAGTIMFADFMLDNQWFAAMDSAHNHQFIFNEALSLVVYCEDQAEIDYYWDKLSAVPESEQCGWLKDKFGVSWQIVPRAMDAMLKGDNRERINRVTQAFLPMKKIDLAKLQEAYDQA